MIDASDDVVSKFNVALTDLAGRGAKVGEREWRGKERVERERERERERRREREREKTALRTKDSL